MLEEDLESDVALSAESLKRASSNLSKASKTIYAFNAEDYQNNKFRRANDELTKTQMFNQHTFAVLLPAMTMGMSGLALAFYRMPESDHSKQGENPVTAFFFVFFGSMAVAGLFELCEFTIAPIMGRDLQLVMDTGVADTMMDMFVCLLGTLVMMWLMWRQRKGKYDPFTGAAEAFAQHNPIRAGHKVK